MTRANTTAATRMQIEHVEIETLHPDPANPRRIGDAELESLTRSMRQWGFVQPVLVRREGMTVIGGHQRLLAARRLGIKHVPVILLDVGLEQSRLLNVALNKISGEWDNELLARMLSDLQSVEDIDLSLTGFAGDELEKLLKGLSVRDKRDRLETFDLDAALEAPRSPTRAQRGELWALGDHRLLVGDSTDAGDVDRLFADGSVAALMATDPPYLVNYQGGEHPTSEANQGRKTKDKHWDDYQDPAAAVEFYAKFLEAALPHLIADVPVYQWHATRRQALVEEAWQQAGLLVHQSIVWAKDRAVLTHSHYMWGHEPCFYGWPEGKKPKRKPPANTSTVWRIGQESLGVHPTQKPLEIFERPIEYHTKPGDVVYEPFAGSGTQFIAAERTGRICYGIELDPHYASVVIARWEAFTGATARCL